jgi:uncharacterized protein YecE (DUF72 family)
MKPVVHIGTAGWQIPKASIGRFPSDGPHLERYSAVFNAVEVNSTFYRLPRLSTAERWAGSVPKNFRFALKMPKSITHELRLRQAAGPLRAFMEVVEAFGERAGPLLVQLPPTLAFSATAEEFLEALHEHDPPPVALEPRHVSWFEPAVSRLLERLHIARVAADPPRAPGDGEPGGDGRLVYIRLHGTPRIYWSEYDKASLKAWARLVERHAQQAKDIWVIFDNTALGAATVNALDMQRLLR